MTGLGLRLSTDEDVDGRLAPQLRRRGYDVLGCAEAGNASQKLDDAWQLAFATGEGRAIILHNLNHYAALHRAWAAQGREHAGIIAVPKLTPLGELVRRTQQHLDTVTPDEQDNAWRFLAP